MNLFGENAEVPVIPQRIPLRDYQEFCSRKTREEMQNFQRILNVLSTAAGKTVIFADLIRQTIPYRSIVLVNRDELVQQACDKIQKALGFHAEIEKAESYADLNAPVVVASVQTLRGKRLERWPQNHFALCISDEAHLSLAPTWLKIMKYFDPYAKIVGFTATPERGDRKNLGEYYETMACEIGLVPLIKQGWLSKLVIKTIPVKIDVSSAKIGSDGDLDAKDVSETLTPYFTQICREIKTHAHGRKILTFLPLVDTSKTFVKVCQAQGINARHVDGESEDRKQILQDYRDNKFELLSNVNLLLAGYDCWDIDCIIPLRPTRSQSVYAQAVGRGTRTPPGVDNFKTPEERLAFIAQSSKKNCLLIDFLWAHERHSLIRPANLVASSKEVAEEMTSMLEAQALGGEAVEELRRRGKNIDPDEIEAEADLITVEAAAVRQREKALLSQIKKSAKKNAKTVSILELAQLTQDARPLDYQETFPWHSLPVTPAQEQALTNCGIDTSDVKDRGQASHLLSIVEERIKSGLPSVAQIKYAKRLGHASPEKLTFDEISKYIESRKAQRTMG